MPKDISAENWETEIEKSTKPVVAEFWQPSCIWCQRLSPVFDELAAESSQTEFVKVDIRADEANMKRATELGIQGTPTMKIFCEGRVVGEIVGFREKAALKEEIDGIVAKSKDCLEKSTAV